MNPVSSSSTANTNSLPTNPSTTSSISTATTSSSSSINPIDVWPFPNQEFPQSFWPFAQYMTPVLTPMGQTLMPTPTPVPYPVPIFYQQPNGGPQYDNMNARFLQNGNNGLRSNDANNNMTIQIGLQCVNQSNPMNINSANDITIPTSFRNPSTMSAIPNASNIIKKTSTNGNNSGSYEGINKAKINRENPKVINYKTTDLPDGKFNPEQFLELARIAMNGCDMAEKIATSHCTRPCFKKIDSLCARLKQDLIRPDSVLANINSQGIAWAVKDFIFVLTRIVNAWIIIKGYVYNTPEGLNRVKNAFSPNFFESFLKWQDATIYFVENLIKSFLNLDQLVQNHRMAYQKLSTNSPSNNTNINEKHHEMKNVDLDKNNNIPDNIDHINNFLSLDEMKILSTDTKPAMKLISQLPTVVESSEETQRTAVAHGTYFKTGVYNPLQRDSNNNNNNKGNKIIFSNGLKANKSEESGNTLMPKLIHSTPLRSIELMDWERKFFDEDTSTIATIMDNSTNSLSNDINISNIDSNILVSKNGEGDCRFDSSAVFVADDIKIREKLCFDFDNLEAMPNSNPNEGISEIMPKLEYLLQKIANLNEAKYFFSEKFTKNYFPDFENIVPNYKDLRSIIIKTEMGQYKTIYEVVHDLRQIVHTAKVYLKKNPQAILLQSIAAAFDKELENTLLEKMFTEWDFSKITGSPNDNLDFLEMK